MYTIVPVELADGRAPFEAWLKQQRPSVQAVADALIRMLLAREGPNVCQGEFGRPLGKGLYELRARQSPRTIFARLGLPIPVGLPEAEHPVLIRVFFALEKDRVVLLLGGLDKGRRNSKRDQSQQIAAARRILATYKTEHRDQ